MFTAIKDNKIIAINNSGKFPCMEIGSNIDGIIEDIDHNIDDFIHVDGEFVLKTNDKAIAKQKDDVRVVRNQYLETYVDPYQLVIRWNILTSAEQEELTNYRQYLLDYTEGKEWWEQNPLTLDEWKEK